MQRKLQINRNQALNCVLVMPKSYKIHISMNLSITQFRITYLEKGKIKEKGVIFTLQTR